MLILNTRTRISSLLAGYSKTLFLKCLYSTETLEPINMSYATYEGTRQENQAPPLLIVHGLLGSKSNWNTLCKVYNQKCNPPRKIIAVDSRNHGDSPHSDNHTYAHIAADIKTLFEQLSINKAVLMGHSMGGRAVMLFALKYPELVDRLVVVDISPLRNSPNMDTMPNIFRALETVNLPSNVSMSKCRTMVEKDLSLLLEDRALVSFLLTNLVEKSSGNFQWRVNIPVLLKNFNNIAKFPLVNELQYHGPTLFLGGGKSDFLQKTDFPEIQKIFPNSELKYIEGTGHWLHSEKPAEFLSITLDFLNRKVEENIQTKSKGT